MKALFITLSFLLVITACTKNDIELPPITQTGENTFGCYVDGKVFIPKDHEGYYPPGGGIPKGLRTSSGDGLPSLNFYSITAINYYTDIAIYIYIGEDRPQQKTYTFRSSPGVEAHIEDPEFPHIFCVINNTLYLSYENSGTIDFQKVDFNQEVCAGVFSVKLKNKNDPTDIIEITEGRFDLICAEPLGD